MAAVEHPCPWSHSKWDLHLPTNYPWTGVTHQVRRVTTFISHTLHLVYIGFLSLFIYLSYIIPLICWICMYVKRFL
ncbi:hypothetical protein M747DRAFT_94987 [Aspergillus niger ATCC 13496]|uniref:Uncharacterized protein n=1 Tax=Aspergillus niger ATCC 13496 TaxID=1353008 RepID=A0A370BQA3_ASPNG|nr:hypothetical protein M747DRAFT_94987 [Aspergillus niger ATCC 13496]